LITGASTTGKKAGVKDLQYSISRGRPIEAEPRENGRSDFADATEP
jgi:hypothetical protein